jgi:hypothetical protein
MLATVLKQIHTVARWPLRDFEREWAVCKGGNLGEELQSRIAVKKSKLVIAQPKSATGTEDDCMVTYPWWIEWYVGLRVGEARGEKRSE